MTFDLELIKSLTPKDPPGCHFNVGVIINVARALSAEFKGHRGQMRGSCCHHCFSHDHTSGGKDVIELVCKEEFRLFKLRLNYVIAFLKIRNFVKITSDFL